MALSAGTRFGPYEILEPLGAGGMGEVYRARDVRLSRTVAVKVLPGAFAADPDRLRRFDFEARAAAAVSHPNVLAVFDVGTYDGSPYVVSELLEGETLRGRIGTRELTVSKAVELAIQIARGLAAAHEKGIVHRDLKPDNVFVTRDGTVKILDFGLAKLTESECAAQASQERTATTATAAVVGTVGYMAPEQLRAHPATAATDLFAFGCVLYEMLSGRRAFQGQTTADIISAILSKDPPPLSGAVDGLPQALERIVGQCLEKRPEARFNSAHDLGLALEALSAETLAGRRGAKLRSAASRGILKPAVGWFGSTVAAGWHSLHTKPLLKLLVGIGVAAAIVVSAGLAIRARRAAWARSVALPELVRLVDGQEYWPAFLLGRRIAAAVPDDPGLQKVWPRFAGEFGRQVLPVGAEVLARRPDGGERDWVELGETGGAPLAVPLGHSVFKVQRAGLEPREFAMTATEFGWDSLAVQGILALVRPGEAPEGMVLIQTLPSPMWFGLHPWRFDFLKDGHIASFFVDRHEVTNREYKRFVDAGGYQRREYWEEPFEQDGKAFA